MRTQSPNNLGGPFYGKHEARVVLLHLVNRHLTFVRGVKRNLENPWIGISMFVNVTDLGRVREGEGG
jgi:hypothetical protein